MSESNDVRSNECVKSGPIDLEKLHLAQSVDLERERLANAEGRALELIAELEAARQQLDTFSSTVTALCEAIDPSFQHGPETQKIVAYAKATRRIAEEMATATNPVHRDHKRRELLQHLGQNRMCEPKPNGGISGELPGECK